MPATDRIELPFSFKLPDVAGGYLLQTNFSKEGSSEIKTSRRYIKIGTLEKYPFFNSKDDQTSFR